MIAAHLLICFLFGEALLMATPNNPSSPALNATDEGRQERDLGASVDLEERQGRDLGAEYYDPVYEDAPENLEEQKTVDQDLYREKRHYRHHHRPQHYHHHRPHHYHHHRPHYNPYYRGKREADAEEDNVGKEEAQLEEGLEREKRHSTLHLNHYKRPHHYNHHKPHHYNNPKPHHYNHHKPYRGRRDVDDDVTIEEVEGESDSSNTTNNEVEPEEGLYREKRHSHYNHYKPHHYNHHKPHHYNHHKPHHGYNHYRGRRDVDDDVTIEEVEVEPDSSNVTDSEIEGEEGLYRDKRHSHYNHYKPHHYNHHKPHHYNHYKPHHRPHHNPYYRGKREAEAEENVVETAKNEEIQPEEDLAREKRHSHHYKPHHYNHHKPHHYNHHKPHHGYNHYRGRRDISLDEAEDWREKREVDGEADEDDDEEEYEDAVDDAEDGSDEVDDDADDGDDDVDDETSAPLPEVDDDIMDVVVDNAIDAGIALDSLGEQWRGKRSMQDDDDGNSEENDASDEDSSYLEELLNNYNGQLDDDEDSAEDVGREKRHTHQYKHHHRPHYNYHHKPHYNYHHKPHHYRGKRAAGPKPKLARADLCPTSQPPAPVAWSLDTGEVPSTLQGGANNDGLQGLQGGRPGRGPQAPALDGGWNTWNTQNDEEDSNVDDVPENAFDTTESSDFGTEAPFEEATFDSFDTSESGFEEVTESSGADCKCMTIMECGATWRNADTWSKSEENPCQKDEVCCEVSKTPDTTPEEEEPYDEPTEQPYEPTEPTEPPYEPTEPPPSSGLECGQSHPMPNDNDGQLSDSTAQFAEFPWTVLLSTKNDDDENGFWKYRCAGTIIDPWIVLTAAHCVDRQDEHSLQITAGDWDLTNDDFEPKEHPKQVRQVSKIKIHDKFKSKHPPNDVALIYLTEPFELSEHINTICLPSNPSDIDFSKCVASGWGNSAVAFGQTQNLMKKIPLPIVPKDQCQKALRKTRLGKYFKLDPTFMCAGGEKGVDVCQGDGGGPLQCPSLSTGHMVQVGITSWGIHCGLEGIPGVFVDVGEVQSWIEAETNARRAIIFKNKKNRG